MRKEVTVIERQYIIWKEYRLWCQRAISSDVWCQRPSVLVVGGCEVSLLITSVFSNKIRHLLGCMDPALCLA